MQHEMQPDVAATDTIDTLLHALQSPDAYPHSVEAIRVIQTHTACVFLTGEYAYKVKKPVNFGFLNYETLERRRLFCEQELALNRQLCPDVYLDVLPITHAQGEEGVRVNGNGSIVEWTVRMRQLRAEDMLPARLRDNALTAADIEQLARLLARFHSQARSDAAVRACGEPAAIADTIAVTLHTMQQVTGSTRWAATCQLLREYFSRFQETQESVFRERLQQNRLRDCHGDLRAQNICLDARFSGGTQVFDCIEFNPAFRFIDTAADIAYLAMDLDLAGRSDLRAHLMEAYMRSAKDVGLPKILPFYLTYRAMVRGNIALLAAQESEVPPAQRQEHCDLADAAYDLALSYAGRRIRPALFITVGFSGSGKSVLARELCRRLPTIYLSTDRLRKQYTGHETAAFLDSSYYTPNQRNTIYEALLQEAGAWLSRGEHVLLDATFLCDSHRQAAAALAQNRNAEFWLLACDCPDEVIRRRLGARFEDPNASDADLSVYLQQRRAYPNGLPIAPEAFLSGGCLWADTTRSVKDSAHDVVARFSRPRPAALPSP